MTLTGVAATGAAIANADLKAVNANGAPSRCTSGSIAARITTTVLLGYSVSYTFVKH